jgi:ubiquitin carboxyl-terminal hydrolase 48
LVPIFTNKQCRSYFKISTNRDYVEVLKKLLKRDPLLTFALQKAVRHLKAGDSKSVSHVTPDPSGHTSSLIGMRITPCVWEQESRTFPALMFEHNVAYNPAVVMPRLMRDYAVLSHVPAILTLIDFQVRA